MLVHARPDDAAFAVCLRLFRQYPLAVRRHYAEHRFGSMVLLQAGPGDARFFVLIMERDDLFVLRPWDRRDGARVSIGRDQPVPPETARLVAAGIPVPRDGALLGWVSGGQVQAVLAAYGRLSEPWDDPSAVPGVLVMPRTGGPSHGPGWSPLAVNPLDGGRLWEWAGRGQLTDLAPLVAQEPGRVFWVPGPAGRAGRPDGARVVVTTRTSGDHCWLPAGVYADHGLLRAGARPQTASQLLTLPGVTDLAGSGRGQPLRV
ncbi:MAG TPA: hypothetical protein VGD91_09005 [Trebonia sp.]